MKSAKKLLRPATTLILTAAAALALLSVSESNEPQLKDPESEFAAIRSDLATMQNRIDTAVNLSARQGLGPQTVEADENYNSALNYYKFGEFAATVRMLNNYLNHSQVPEFARYLKAQYLLGRSYEHLGRKDQAVRAYLRYVAAFLTATSTDHEEFLDVLRRTVSLSIDAEDYSIEAGSLIASLTSLDLPPEVKNIVNLIAAKSAVRNRNNNVAARLLEETIKGSADKTLKAKSFYIKALLAISQKDYATAEEYLAEATHADVDGTTKDLARLALARLSVKRNKPETALKYYTLIDEKSEQFKDALFESIYVHINREEDPQARAKALLFLARFKDSPEAVQLRMILAYLDLRAGDYGAARVTLENAEQRVQDVDQYLYKNLIHKTAITSADIATLSGLTAGHIDDIPAIRDASALFARLTSIQKTLSDLDGEIRSIGFVTSQSSLAGQNPGWVNRSEQLATIGDQLLMIGHRLISTERFLYEKDFDQLTRQKLEASESRRAKLLGVNISLKRKNLNWKAFRNYLQVHQALTESGVRLASAEAGLASLKLSAKGTKPVLTAVEVEELAKKVARMRRDHNELSRKTSLSRIENSGLEGPHHGARKFLSDYVAALEEESQLIGTARETQKGTASRLLAGDAKDYWQQWRFAVGSVLDGFNKLDDEITASLTASVRKLEALTERQRELSSRMAALVSSLEGGLGSHMHSILNQYSLALSQKSARNKKWKADIDWLEFQQKQQEESGLTQKFQLEKQILDENLRDIRQGLIW
jgi:predicted negative regulator of RcsB-dependent stress response